MRNFVVLVFLIFFICETWGRNRNPMRVGAEEVVLDDYPGPAQSNERYIRNQAYWASKLGLPVSTSWDKLDLEIDRLRQNRKDLNYLRASALPEDQGQGQGLHLPQRLIRPIEFPTLVEMEFGLRRGTTTSPNYTIKDFAREVHGQLGAALENNEGQVSWRRMLDQVRSCAEEKEHLVRHITSLGNFSREDIQLTFDELPNMGENSVSRARGAILKSEPSSSDGSDVVDLNRVNSAEVPHQGQ